MAREPSDHDDAARIEPWRVNRRRVLRATGAGLGAATLAGPIERWGDYNDVSVDPTRGSFWTVNQYSPDIDILLDEPERDPYFTRIAEITFDGDRGDG